VADFLKISEKIFEADESIRGVTFGRFDGEILYFAMRPGIESLNPPGEIGKMDAEVLLPSLSDYFDMHKKYFGRVQYVVVKFEKVSIIYVRHENIFAIVSVKPEIDVYPIVKKVKSVIKENIKLMPTEQLS
jgi:hypothetical protein